MRLPVGSRESVEDCPGQRDRFDDERVDDAVKASTLGIDVGDLEVEDERLADGAAPRGRRLCEPANLGFIIP